MSALLTVRPVQLNLSAAMASTSPSRRALSVSTGASPQASHGSCDAVPAQAEKNAQNRPSCPLWVASSTCPRVAATAAMDFLVSPAMPPYIWEDSSLFKSHARLLESPVTS